MAKRISKGKAIRRLYCKTWLRTALEIKSRFLLETIIGLRTLATAQQLITTVALYNQDKVRFSMHYLRRSFVANLPATGTDPKSVQVLAGHADVRNTLKHYVGVRAKNLTALINRLSKRAKRTT